MYLAPTHDEIDAFQDLRAVGRRMQVLDLEEGLLGHVT
jgi:hypothetical protein